MIRIALAVLMLVTTPAWSDTLRMAVTTSFQNSGLADVLLPEIEADLDLDVQLLVVGTGQALRLGEAGDVDAILVHSRAAEEAFVSAGFAPHRREVMYNDFVLIGPSGDAASVAASASAVDALIRIREAGALFVSRGDDSGTHKMELSLWAEAGLETEMLGDWYRAVGAGMGAALNTAAGLDAYILSDRASWISFGNKGALELQFEGDPALLNQYAYLPIDPARHPHVEADHAARLEEWLVSDRARVLIDGYRLGGEQLFVFNAE